MLDSYDLLSKIDSTYDIEELSRLELLLLQSKLTENIKDSFTKPGGFMNFVRHFWSSVEPEKEMKQGWILEAIGEHLEACIDGRITRLLINVPPGSSKPVYEEELIFTDQGFIKLKDIQIGDMVLTHKGRFRKVSDVHKQGELPLLRINTFDGRSVRTAFDHPFLTTRGWIQAQHLTNHDYVGTPHIKEEFGNNSISSEEARLLGYLVADGSISQRSLSYVSADQESIDDFIYCAKFCGFYAYSVIHPVKKVKAIKVILKSSETRVKNGIEPPILDWLRKYELYRTNSYTKHIPKQIFESGPIAISNFLGAYWSGDGTIIVRHSNNKTTMKASATTVSKKLADDIQRALFTLNIQSRIRKRQVNLNTKSQLGGKYTSYEIVTSQRNEVAKIAKLKGLVERKRIKAEVAFFDRFEPNIYEDAIIDIKSDICGNCRCLEVEDDHSFTVNGLIVHNSLLCSVFLPAYIWGPMNYPSARILNISYSASLPMRDNRRMLRLIRSPEYQKMYGDLFKLTKDGEILIENNCSGFKNGLGISGGVTGNRCDFLICDDLNNITAKETKDVMDETNRKFIEGVSNRLNDMVESVIIVIAQRCHQNDVSGFIIKSEFYEDYVHLCIPFLFEGRICKTKIGWTDPRIKVGELYWPEHFPESTVPELMSKGDMVWDSQYQQSPSSRKSAIIGHEHWMQWTDKLPQFDYILASADTAYTAKSYNDPSGFVIFGCFNDHNTHQRAIMLLDAFSEHLEIVSTANNPRIPGERPDDYLARPQNKRGLVETILDRCTRRWNVNHLIVEGKASGICVIQTLNSYLGRKPFNVTQYDPRGIPKETRALVAQPTFSSGQVYVPMKYNSETDKFEHYAFSKLVMDECAAFPGGSHDDLVDAVSQAIHHLRNIGLLQTANERKITDENSRQHKRRTVPLY